MSKKIAEAVGVALAITNTELPDVAVQVLVSELSQYPEQQVVAALVRCYRELKSKLTLADVLERITDGRPSPEEAWAMVPKNEEASVFWTTEMRDAYKVVHELVRDGALIPARMAFLEKYRSLLAGARSQRAPIEWEYSPGYDRDGRERVLLEAVELGRLKVESAFELLPHNRDGTDVGERLLTIANSALKRLK